MQKFVDCRTKDASRRELYIVEGDSAMGAVKTSRDSEYQAIMPIRGKILNCLKADYARIFKSDVIVDLIKVMGCGVELGGKHNKELATFNLDNLRFNKIVICTDADVDGYQIRTLVLTMLYRLTPTLINEGYVYIAESPLYEITTKDRTYFAYTEPEKATFLEEIGDKKYTIQRSKGLGENDPEMMWLTTMNPESRRLIKVMPTDVERTARCSTSCWATISQAARSISPSTAQSIWTIWMCLKEDLQWQKNRAKKPQSLSAPAGRGR